MGGGKFTRPVGRAPGCTTSASSTSFCSACNCRVPHPSSMRTVCDCCQNMTLSCQGICTRTESELGDWEFADDWDNPHTTVSTQEDSRWFFSPASSALDSLRCEENLPSYDRDQLVFERPPTFEEVREATSQLEAAYRESIAADNDTNSMASGSVTLEQEGLSLQGSHEGSDCEEAHSEGWIEPPTSSELPLTHFHKNSIYEAFQLLQSNSNVKNAVMSVAVDPTVWIAMINNKEMQELRQKCKKSEEEEVVAAVETAETRSQRKGDNHFGRVPSALRTIIGMSMGAVCRVPCDLVQLVMAMMSVLNRSKRSSAKDHHMDNTASSTVMLAMLVMVVVLLKRLPA